MRGKRVKWLRRLARQNELDLEKVKELWKSLTKQQRDNTFAFIAGLRNYAKGA